MLAPPAGTRSVHISDGMFGGHVHTGDIIYHGITQLLPEYEGPLRNFLDAYLGTPENPVPFGGRRGEMESLNAWLYDPSAPPYLLLTAPAGRGKSALVAHWVHALVSAGDPDLDVVYLPISIRYQTNREGVVFASLAARLAKLRGKPEELRSALGSSPQQWRALVAKHLRAPTPGRRLLLVLDGADEAAEWELGSGLFPPYPTPELRVLVSARLTVRDPTPRHWLEALDWDRRRLARTTELAGLDRQGVEEALRSMGVPLHEMTGVDVVGQILRLSEGDPILVRLYVESLWTKDANAVRLRPEELEAIEPGLRSYFRKWWRDQMSLWGAAAPAREAAARPVLNLLACARGPLQTEDLLWLAGGNTGLDVRSLRGALGMLGRLVVGNGSTQGYVFAHPRLASFFRDEESDQGVPRSEQQMWEARFLAYGQHVLAALNDGRMSPDEAPRYVVEHYGAHLVRYGTLDRSGVAMSEWEQLVSEGWWRAWVALEGSYGGFLGDVDRAWEAARIRNRTALAKDGCAEYLGFEVLCALCHARSAAQSNNLAPELGAAFVRKGIWTLHQALANARRMQEPEQRAQMLGLLLEFCPGDVKAGVAVDALEAADQIEYRGGIRLSVALARYLPEDQRKDVFRRLLHAAQLISYETERMNVFVALVSDLPAGLHSEFLDAAQQFKYEHERCEVLAALAPHVPEVMQAEVLHIAEQFESDWGRAVVLAALAPRVSEVLQGRILHAAEQIPDEFTRAKVLADLAPHAPEVLQSGVLNAAERIGQLWKRVRVLAALAPHVSEVLQAEILHAAERIGVEYHRVEVLDALVPHVAEGLRAEFLQVVQRIAWVEERARLSVALARHLPGVQREDLLRETLQAAQQIEDKAHWAKVLTALASHVPKALQVEVLHVAEQIGNEAVRAGVLTALAAHLPEELQAEFLHVAREIGDGGKRAEVLVALAPHLSEGLRAELLQEARQISDETKRARVLAALAPHVSESLRAELLETARQIGDGTERARLLADLVPSLPESHRESVVREAFQAAQQVPADSERAKFIASLVPHLPEGLQAEALHAAREFFESDRLLVLTSLVPHLPEGLQAEMLQEARQIGDVTERAFVLSALVPHVPEGQREDLLNQALQVARQSASEGARARVLASLSQFLPEDQREDVLREALREALMWNGDEWVDTLVALGRQFPEGIQAELLKATEKSLGVLSGLAPHLPGHLQAAVLQAAQLFEHEEYRARLLAALAPNLTEELRADFLQAAQQIGDHGDRARVLTALGPRLPEEVQTEVLHTAKQISDEGKRAEVLAALAPHLPEGLKAELLQATQQIEHYWIRTRALDAIVPHLPEVLQAEFLDAAQQIGDEKDRARVLAIFGFRLPAGLQTDVVQATLQIEDEMDRARVLADLAPHLPETLQAELLGAAQQMEDERNRASVLGALAPHVPEALQAEVLHAAEQIQYIWTQLPVLAALAPHVTEVLQTKMLEAAQRMHNMEERTKFLAALALHFSEQKRKELLLSNWWAGPVEEDEERLDASLFPLFSSLRCYEFWSEVLTRVSPSLWGSQHRLISLGTALGGECVAEEIAHSLLVTSRWWR